MKEIGKYMDLPSMISMSFVNKEFQKIYQPYFSKLVNEIDPYIENGTVMDYLNITKVGTVEQVVYKIWKNIFDSIIRETSLVNPSYNRKQMIDVFQKVIPNDAIELLKENIKKFINQCERFLVYRNVVYRNPSITFINLSDNFETDINDMLDVLLHEMACQSGDISRDNSLDSLADSTPSDTTPSSEANGEEIEIAPYENVADSIETFIRYL